ncbi:MAG TPA: hypothetical protein VJ045_05610 [Hyphomicrobiaceae bacterium]|nr:hypothetical protein [Hyphomicrobiaceae bacterium]
MGLARAAQILARRGARLVFAGALLAVGLTLPGPERADGAVRLCRAPLTSGLFASDVEAVAKKQALDDWKAKAGSFGEEYAGWGLAMDRFLRCLPGRSGGFECLVRGTPCTIEQAPARRHLRSKRLGI